jgi:3-phosphoshikimate 1-carboxyvinyltransferase
MINKHNPLSLISSKITSFISGEIEVPGDKSISHRTLIFASLANGSSKISNLLEGEDVLRTAEAMRRMGVEINRDSDRAWKINGSGVAGLMEPNDVLDMGNSGTAARLLMGLVTPFNFNSFFTGDSSLRKRPMQRVFEPLTSIGAKIISRKNNVLPAVIIGADEPLPINYTMKVASAQVKSSILLAALNTPGTTTIIEPEKCRDHTEIMMRYLGLEIKVEEMEINGKIGNKISYNGCQEFDAKDFIVPGDISSAAFIIVAALIIPNSKVRINNVGINPLRDGIIKTLKEMGGNIIIENQRLAAGEKVADLIVEYSQLKGIDIPALRAPEMIDEYPILAIAAANADGITKMNGLAELKVKESNRLNAIAEGLKNCGVEIKIGDDSLEVAGGLKQPKELVKIKTYMDHRIAMSFLIMGLKLENGVEIDDYSMINTSFPTFIQIFNKFGITFKQS